MEEKILSMVVKEMGWREREGERATAGWYKRLEKWTVRRWIKWKDGVEAEYT